MQFHTAFSASFLMAHFEAKYPTLDVENIKDQIINFTDVQKHCGGDKLTKFGIKTPQTCSW